MTTTRLIILFGVVIPLFSSIGCKSITKIKEYQVSCFKSIDVCLWIPPTLTDSQTVINSPFNFYDSNNHFVFKDTTGLKKIDISFTTTTSTTVSYEQFVDNEISKIKDQDRTVTLSVSDIKFSNECRWKKLQYTMNRSDTIWSICSLLKRTDSANVEIEYSSLSQDSVFFKEAQASVKTVKYYRDGIDK